MRSIPEASLRLHTPNQVLAGYRSSDQSGSRSTGKGDGVYSVVTTLAVIFNHNDAGAWRMRPRSFRHAFTSSDDGSGEGHEAAKLDIPA